jgi:hypothetical protein
VFEGIVVELCGEEVQAQRAKLRQQLGGMK